jgi:hypothetical protein
MITYGKLETMRRSGRHLGVMSTAVAALALLLAGAAVGFGAAAAPLWHSMRERTT